MISNIDCRRCIEASKSTLHILRDCEDIKSIFNAWFLFNQDHSSLRTPHWRKKNEFLLSNKQLYKDHLSLGQLTDLTFKISNKICTS